MNREEALIEELVSEYDGMDIVCDYIIEHDNRKFCERCRNDVDRECIKKYISLKYGVSFG